MQAGFSRKKTAYFASLIKRAIQHFSEIVTINEQQIKLNEAVVAELAVLQNTLMATINHYSTWAEFLQAHHHLSLESQEVIISCLMELYPERVDAFQEKINADAEV